MLVADRFDYFKNQNGISKLIVKERDALKNDQCVHSFSESKLSLSGMPGAPWQLRIAIEPAKDEMIYGDIQKQKQTVKKLSSKRDKTIKRDKLRADSNHCKKKRDSGSEQDYIANSDSSDDK